MSVKRVKVFIFFLLLANALFLSPLFAGPPATPATDIKNQATVSPERARRSLLAGMQLMRSNPTDMKGYLLACAGGLALEDLRQCLFFVRSAESSGVRLAPFYFELSKTFLKYRYPSMAILYLQSAEAAWARERAHGAR